MKTIKKLFSSNTKFDTYPKILFLSEGYLENEKQDFFNACKEFISRYLNFTPFNIAKCIPLIDVYSCFIPSDFHGVSSEGIGDGLTSFNSKIDQNGKWFFSSSNLTNIIDSLLVYDKNKHIELKYFLKKGIRIRGSDSCIICILSPSLNLNEIMGISAEYIPSESEYYFIATSTDGYWEQLIIRTLGIQLGLGDEYSLKGENYNKPLRDDIGYYLNETYPNLLFLPAEGFPPTKEFPPEISELTWSKFFHIDANLDEINIFDYKSSYYENKNRNYSHEKLGLWEGGAQFKKEIFKSSKSCLMGAQIEGVNSQILTIKYNFCKICENHIQNYIKQKIEYTNVGVFKKNLMVYTSNGKLL